MASKQFEYRTMRTTQRDEESLVDWLNTQGQSGWELVSIDSYFKFYICFFKREI